MEFRKIVDLGNAVDIERLYEESFPQEERVPFGNLFSGVFNGFELYALYKENQLVAMIHFNASEEFLHVNYLAVAKEFHSKGYGSGILTWVKNQYPNRSIVLDVEAIDETASNYTNRIRRSNFYKRNGFVPGKYIFWWEGTLMTYMNYGSIDGDKFMEYIKIIFPTISDVRLIS